MKKIFVGGSKACTIHNEKNFINSCIRNNSKYETTDNYTEADLIVITDACTATYDCVLESFDYLVEVLDNKMDTAQVILSGCLSKGFKLELSEEIKEILDKVDIITPDKITEHVVRLINGDLDERLLRDCRLPFSFSRNRIYLSPVSGCLNHCSFCKTNYMNFPLKSADICDLEKFTLDLNRLSDEGNPFHYIGINSSNLSLYGVDLYGYQRCHEAIKTLTSAHSIKWANVGALINWYPELINEILNNDKIKSIFISLESGSDRIYNLMNRPIELTKLKSIIKTIRRQRPDILIDTEIICGYPTESFDDLKQSIDVIYELDINPAFVHPYDNSFCIPSSKLPQHSYDYAVECAYYATDKLLPLRNKFDDIIKNGEMLVLDKNDNAKIYRVMLTNGGICNVRYDQFDKAYETCEIIPAQTIKDKHLVKKKKSFSSILT